MIQEKRIRDALVARLTGRTQAGAQVTTSRALPWRKNRDGPGLAIYTIAGDPSDFEETMEGRKTRWDLEIAVEIFVREVPPTSSATKQSTGLPDDEISILAEEVNRAIEADRTLGLTRDEVELINAKPARWEVDFTAEGHKLEGGARLSWVWSYLRLEEEGDPDDLGAFEQANIDYDLVSEGAPTGDDVDATDLVDLPQS